MTKHNLSLKERFLLYVNIPENLNDCWEWVGGKSSNGYGAFNINRKMCCAHRVSYALFVDRIPDDMDVCHKCDNRACVNPAHFFLGTNQDNMNDKVKKNRQSHHTKNRGENHWSHKLTEQEIYQIREMSKQGYTQQEIANVFGVSQSNIYNIQTGRKWGWLK